MTWSTRPNGVIGNVSPCALPPEKFVSTMPKWAACGDEQALPVDRGQVVPGRQRDDQIAMKGRGHDRCHDPTAIRSSREGRDGALDLAGVAHIDRFTSTLSDGATA
jgi:hypothetical protein